MSWQENRFRFVANCRKYCAENGCESITVETLSPKQNDPHYLKTYQFYEKSGFKPLFELSPYGPELLMCYMLKRIKVIIYEDEVI